MSHATKFAAPQGWHKAVLIHDGHGMPGTVELRAWYYDGRIFFSEDAAPDFVALLHENGRIEEKVSKPAPCDTAANARKDETQRHERELLVRAGEAIGAARLSAKINRVLENHA